MKEKHLVWIDWLRIIACFFVVVSHCSDPYLFTGVRNSFVQGWAIGSVVRCSVPLFVMMSGALLLPTSLSLRDFYSKRIKRLAIPLLFWSITLPFLFYAYLRMAGGSSFPLLNVSSYTLESTIYKSLTFFLNFNYDTTPLWYLYMLLGLYLIIPILSSWIKSATQHEVKTVLLLWGATLFLPYVELAAKELGFIGYPGCSAIFGVCDWNVFGTFYYISGFIGYLLLGYYLRTYPPQWSWKNTWAICIPMFIVGVCLTFMSLDLLMSHMPHQLSFAWHFAIAHVFFITFPLFIVIQKVKFKPCTIVSNIASTTFGIYLSHFIFIHIGYDLFQHILPTNTPPILQILCNAIGSFAVCCILIGLMLRFKFTKPLVA